MNRRGFTLIEMLVVIAILGSLAVMLLPVLVNARANARQVICASNLNQIRLAMQLYYSSAHYLPMDSLEPGGVALADSQTSSLWTGDYNSKRGLGLLALDYAQEPEIFFEREANWAQMEGPSGWKAPDGALNWENPAANVLSSYVYRQGAGKRAEKENAGVSHALVTEYTMLDAGRYNHGARGAHALYSDGSVTWRQFTPGDESILRYDWYTLESVDVDSGKTGWETWLDARPVQ